MDDGARALEAAVWAAVEGIATAEQSALLKADARAHLRVLERLLDEAEDRYDEVRAVTGSERDQVLADVEAELDQLEAAYDALTGTTSVAPPTPVAVAAEPVGEVRLQASWSGGQVIVWAAGPGTAPASNEDLSDRLEAIGGPPLGWSQYPAVRLPNGARADALSIPVAEALGWLVAVGGGLGRDGVGLSLTWLGRVAVAAVRLVAQGRLVPTLRSEKRPDGRSLDVTVRWLPALVDDAEVAELAAAMPGPITVLGPADPRVTTRLVLAAVVDAIATDAAGRLELPAPPPATRTTAAVAEAVVTRLDGSSFVAPVTAYAEVSKRLDRWAKPVTAQGRRRLVVHLDPPDKGNAWFLSVLGPGAEGMLPVELALADTEATKPLADELARLERIFPRCCGQARCAAARCTSARTRRGT